MKHIISILPALLLVTLCLASCGVHTHTPEEIPAVAPTCAAEGSTVGQKCASCGEILKEPGKIPALAHTPISAEPVAPTCTAAGETGGTYCAVCGTVLAAPAPVEPIPHTPVSVAAVPATCTENGHTAGTRCDVCQTVLSGCETLAAPGHTVATYKGVAPDCTHTGLSDGTYCTVCLMTLAERETLPATGHTYVVDADGAATCTTPGLTRGKHCAVCGYVLLSQKPTAALGHAMTFTPAVPVTCTTDGNVAYYSCSRCTKLFSDRAGTAELTATVLRAEGHKLSFIKDKAVTYPTPGVVDCYYCSVCEKYYTDASATVVLSDDPFKDFHAVLRFTVGSDTHYNPGDSTQRSRVVSYVNRSFDVYALDPTYKGVDCLALVGDITSSGTAAYALNFVELISGAVDKVATRPVEFMAVMGNHEATTESFQLLDYDTHLASFTDAFGPKNLAFKLCGFWFIGISPHYYTYEPDTLAFLEEKLAAAAADDPTGKKPIFVFCHLPPKGTVLYTNDLCDAGNDIDRIFAQYPQIVDFSGHTHCILADPCSFWQGDYTVFNTGTMLWATGNRYTENGQVKLVGDTNVKGNFNSSYGFSTCYNHPFAWVVEVDAEGNIAIRGFDVQADNYVTETYMLHAGKKDYPSDTRFDDAEIFFDDTAKITVNNFDNSKVNFTYDVVSDDGFLANNYLMELYDKNGKILTSKYIMYEYYNPVVEKTITWTLSGSGLTEGFTIRVYGLNPLYNVNLSTPGRLESEPLVYVYKP